MSMRSFRPSPAMVVALFALVVSLSGVGYAAGLIGTGDIKNGAVTTPKIHSLAVTKGKVHSGAIDGTKVVDNSLTGADIDESSLGQVPSASNAQTLQGFGPAAFERSGTVLFGSGAINALSNQSIFSSSLVGMGLATDGDADPNSQLLLTNNNATGNLIGTPYTKNGAGTTFGVVHGTSSVIGPASGAGDDFLDVLITDAASPPSHSLWLHCIFHFESGTPIAFCWGIQAT